VAASHHPPSDVDVRLMQLQIPEQIEAYADAYTTPNSPTVSAILAETETASPFPIMAGGMKEARLLQALVALTDATRVLEFGTFTGATAVSLAEALPEDGRVVTLEHDPEMVEVARRHAASDGLDSKIDFLVGDARELVDDVDGPFELVFIDALKAEYVDYYEAALAKLAERGVIVADNVLFGGLPYNQDANDSETEGVRRFVAHVQKDPRTRNVILTVGDGLMLIWKT